MAELRGADHLVRGLKAAGVQRIFSLSGNQIMPVFDACLDAEIDLLHVRHEAATVHMADAWGRLTGEPGIALVTGGPGHANAVSALYTALMSESPVVFMSGHAPASQLGQGAFQEMAQVAMAAPVCKAAWMVESAAAFESDARRAIDMARSGRPGPVHLSLPFDLLNQVCEPEPVQAGSTPSSALDAGLEAVSASIEGEGAARPLVLVGPQLLRALGQPGLRRLAGVVGAPVVGSDSPRGVGDPALGAFADVLVKADRVVALGRPVDFTLKMGRAPALAGDARFVLLGADEAALSASRAAIGDPDRIDACILTDPLEVAKHLLDTGAPAALTPWAEEVYAATDFRPSDWARLVSQSPDCLHALEVARAIDAVYEGFQRGTLVMDGGEFGQWMQACLQSPVQMTNGPGGSIGSALPMAIAARVARPDEPVVALLGDGTLGFHLAEFDTAVRYGLDFVAIVGNDACWNAEYQIQLRDYGPQRLVGCELAPTRYDEVVRAMGGHGEHVTRAEDLPAALERARDSGKPACVNVALERNAAPSVKLPA